MLAGERVGRVIGVQDACVRDAGDASCLRGGNHIRVLRQPLTCLVAGHQQQAVHTDERRWQSVRSSVVCHTHVDAAFGQIGDVASGAHDRDDVRRWHTASQQFLNGEAAQMSGRPRDSVDALSHRVTNCGEKAAA